MKIHNLFHRSNIILETEDDMFPGIDSSAFDEVKPEGKSEDLDAMIAEEQRLRDITKVYSYHFAHILDELEDNDAWIRIPLGGVLGPTVVAYSSFDWYSKYSEELLDGFAISKNSPLFDNIERNIHNLNKHRERIRFHSGKSLRLKIKLDGIIRGMRKK